MDPTDDDGLGRGLQAGRRIGPWTLEARLGAGGVATVWRAHDAAGCVAALKLVPMHAVDVEDLTRLEREHLALARLDHPNVVRVLGQGRGDGVAWIALEYVDGEDLEAVLRRWREHPPADRFAQAEAIFRQLAAALDHIHGHGFVHRDVKPANALLGHDGRVRLVDFGVVTVPEISRITLVGRLVGTIAYMAPELIAEEPVDARADLYGLGAVLYALLTLRRPIEADSVAGFLARHLTTTPAPPHELDPDVPRHLERVALRLLEKDPARRYPTARAALDALASDEPGPSSLHGRGDVVQLWRERLEAARGGVGSVVVLDGPPGSGRTALVRHLAELAREVGLDVADAREPAASEAEVVVADDVERLPPDARRRVDTAVSERRLVALVEPAGRQARADVHVVRLVPLGRRALAQMLRDHGVPTAVAAALATRIEASGTGWPGAVLTLLEALVRDGWLLEQGGVLVAARTLEDFRTADLPVPDADRRALLGRLGLLGDDERELLELLALLGRDAGASLLARAATSAARAPAAVDRLLREGWIRAEAGDDDLKLRLAHPSASTVVREVLDPETRRQRHLAIAQVLARRRRRGSAEAAAHLTAGGRPDEAIPMFAAAARGELESGDAAAALQTTLEGEAALARAIDVLPEADADRWRRLLTAQRGAALLALGRWPEAVPALEDALERARASGDPRTLARAATNLGRAHYRLGRLDAAAVAMEEALRHGEPGTPEVDDARRSLADIHLQHGRLDGAMVLLRGALDAALARGSRDEEARARRGIAHVYGLEGRYAEAGHELETADDLLAMGGDVRVRAGVLLRMLELDGAAGRLALALHRSELLIDLLQTHALSGPLPEALAVAATLRHAVGQDDEAAGLAHRALMLARARPAVAWQAVLCAVRVLAELDRLAGDEVDVVLAVTSARSDIRRPAAQALALAARLVAPLDPIAATAHLLRSDAEPPATWGLAEIDRSIDAAWADLTLGRRDDALDRIARAEALLPDDRAAGVRLGLLAVRAAAGDTLPPGVVRALLDAVAAPLPGRLRQAFSRRRTLAPLLVGDPGVPAID